MMACGLLRAKPLPETILTHCYLDLQNVNVLAQLHVSPGHHHDIDYLTHLPLDKMAAILTDDILKSIFLNEDDKILIQISLKLVPKSPIDNKPALAQVMSWRRRGNKPLPEPMLTQFTDTYMWH